MISNFFKTYLRTLWRNKIYSSINTIGLSMAMACAMLIILYANDEASYDRFHENGKNIFRVIMLSGAAVTIFLSCIGLFGLSVMAAEKRMKEIGIRKVLGASVAAAVSILTRDFLKLVSISMVIAIPVSWLLTDKWLQNYPYHIYLGWTVFAGGGLMMIVISLATVSFQALKTALSNPVDALRTE